MMPSAIPVATYRIQFSKRFGFDDAVALVPYLKALGISHLYASPFLQARAGSSHGYDVVDHNSFNDELGGQAAFERLSDALARADLGLILDFVPNHMGVHYADNDWWLDVLEWGPKSPYAASFDIDWDTLQAHPGGGVLVPVLGRSYGEALEAGEIEVRFDSDSGTFSAWYYEHRLPIEPNRYSEILEKVVTTARANETPAGRRLLEIAERYHGPHNPPREKASNLKAELAAVAGGREIIECGLQAYRPSIGDTAAIASLHYLLERQHYRLANWRLAGSEINYRRFFDINTLAGLRVEHADTFQAIHRLVRDLIRKRCLHGLRLDHIDGLRDPHQYFRRLQRLIETEKSDDKKFFVVVEKILADGEKLPRFAGVSGTTGYEWLNVISRLLIDDRGLSQLDRTWRRISGDERGFGEVLIAAKRRVLETILASEFTVLARLLARLAAGHYSTRDFAAHRLRAALELFILYFPIYRTYLTNSGPSREDRTIINTALSKARSEWFGPDTDIFAFLQDVLTLDLTSGEHRGHSRVRNRRFAFKVQQFTGPMMAKSLEDTAFYRYHRLLALNEVGGDPSAHALPIEEFHQRMRDRIARSPHGLTTTATHDTKRGEDARTRLLALTELSEEWDTHASEWRQLNKKLTAMAKSRPTVAHEYMLYQSLLGAWPLSGLDEDFVKRFQDYSVKAAREGKQETNWLAPDEGYEEALKDFVRRMLDRGESARFLDSFGSFARRAALIGALKSLAQITLKTTIPGIPDFYQGTEFWDLSLVDPDNRRPVDFPTRQSELSLSEEPNWPALASTWPDGRIKFALTLRLLELRRRHSELFRDGIYLPVEVSGPARAETIAFARVREQEALIVVAGRLFGHATDGGRRWPGGQAWEGRLRLERFTDIRNLVMTSQNSQDPSLSRLFEVLPIALLHAQFNKRSHSRSLKAPVSAAVQ